MNEQFSSGNNLISLENIRVASPCRADWNKMQGDERVRFCGSCEKHVYNLSALSKDDAENLIAEKEGRLCVRYFQRADGTVLTGNCPVGMRVARRPFKFLLAGFAVLAASGVSVFSSQASTPVASGETAPRPSAGFLRAVIERFDSDTAIEGDIAAPTPPLMGKPVCPAPTPTPTPTPQPQPKE